MNNEKMTSMERVLAALEHKEADRVPFFLMLSLQGARELNLSIKEYFSRPEYVFEGQMLLREKYRDDCLFGFYYGPIETEAWGGDVVFREDGPPNSGAPFITSPADIDRLTPPAPEDAPCLQRVLRTIEMLKKEAGDTVPIIGVAISPFSLPVMQLGFGPYLDLIHNDQARFEQLMEVNKRFCLQWANAQLEAGAASICYFDPVSSPTIIPPELYRETGFLIARETIAQITGLTAIHLASGISLPIASELAETGTALLGVSAEEDLADLKEAFRNKLTLAGNLNGIEMRHWTAAQTRDRVIEAINKAGPGGGFILSDNHGEIPWQVSEEIVMTISETVREYGRYPLEKE